MILSLDAGTTSIRGILFDDKGGILYCSQKKTSPEFPDALRVEQDPLVWKDALFSILNDCAAYSREGNQPIEAVTVTAFRSPVFPVDRQGNPLMRAIMWQDRRTDELCRELGSMSSQVYEISGLPIKSVFSAVKMLWIRRNEPELYERSYKFCGIYDYLIYLMTGEFVTDKSIASRFNLYNLESQTWDEKLLDLFRVSREKLPRVVGLAESCGSLLPEAACGLPPGIPVISGGGDQQCAALGLGIISTGQVALNTGTGAYLIGLSDRPYADPDQAIYNNIAAVPGMYIREAQMMTAGTVYRWFSEVFSDPGTEEKERFAAIDAEIAASPAGAGGVVLIPRFKGARTGPGSMGAFLNLGLETSRGDMARAVLEGIALEMDELLKKMERNQLVDEVYVSGGMTRFPLYNQILADVLEKKVIAGEDGEATARGAWMNAMRAVRGLSSYEGLLPQKGRCYLLDPDNSAVYDEARRDRKVFSACIHDQREPSG